jgi:hypothetical protein
MAKEMIRERKIEPPSPTTALTPEVSDSATTCTQWSRKPPRASTRGRHGSVPRSAYVSPAARPSTCPTMSTPPGSCSATTRRPRPLNSRPAPRSRTSPRSVSTVWWWARTPANRSTSQRSNAESHSLRTSPAVLPHLDRRRRPRRQDSISRALASLRVDLEGDLDVGVPGDGLNDVWVLRPAP